MGIVPDCFVQRKKESMGKKPIIWKKSCNEISFASYEIVKISHFKTEAWKWRINNEEFLRILSEFNSVFEKKSLK